MSKALALFTALVVLIAVLALAGSAGARGDVSQHDKGFTFYAQCGNEIPKAFLGWVFPNTTRFPNQRGPVVCENDNEIQIYARSLGPGLKRFAVCVKPQGQKRICPKSSQPIPYSDGSTAEYAAFAALPGTYLV